MGGLCEEISEKDRGGRSQLRWEDCVKRDLRKEEKLGEKANNQLKNITNVAVQQSDY